MRLKDNVAIITGAGQGIGQAKAVKFASEGARVVVCDIKDASVRDTVQLIAAAGGEAIGFVVGVIGMVKTWARELGRKGIRANAVCPGFIETPILSTMPEKIVRMMEERVPLGRLGKPEEIAATYAWLASSEASYINGAVIEVSGGATL